MVAAWWWHRQAWQQGYDARSAEVAEAVNSESERQRNQVKTIIKWREKEKVVYRDRIKRIRETIDKTGCADTRLVDMGFGL